VLAAAQVQWRGGRRGVVAPVVEPQCLHEGKPKGLRLMGGGDVHAPRRLVRVPQVELAVEQDMVPATRSKPLRSRTAGSHWAGEERACRGCGNGGCTWARGTQVTAQAMGTHNSTQPAPREGDAVPTHTHSTQAHTPPPLHMHTLPLPYTCTHSPSPTHMHPNPPPWTARCGRESTPRTRGRSRLGRGLPGYTYGSPCAGPGRP
jgi:hypothetical protein